MNETLSQRELSKMWTNPIVLRVHERGSRKITREYVISTGLVFQPSRNGLRLINTLDNFLHAILSTQ